jgi:hypothetical protein
VSQRRGIESGIRSGVEILDSASPVVSPAILALNSTWYQSYESASFRCTKALDKCPRWDYYGCHKDSNGLCQDWYAPRDFCANLTTLSVRCAF